MPAKLRIEPDARAVQQHLVVQIARPDCEKRSGTRYAVEHAFQRRKFIVAFLRGRTQERPAAATEI
jgi:hypothetical protein